MTTPVEIVRPHIPARKVIVMLLTSWLGVFVTAAITMLLLGGCHHEIDHRVPALGYLQTVLGLYTLRFVGQFVTPWDHYKIWTREAAKRGGAA